MISVLCCEAGEADARQPALVVLLKDVVDAGASIGFLPPLDEDEATRYWQGVTEAVAAGSRVLLVALVDGVVAGSAQLDLCQKPNGAHRAEVMKVMVQRDMRRRGIGRALMVAVEDEARRCNRSTLVLDTRKGDPSETLYLSCRWDGHAPARFRATRSVPTARSIPVFSITNCLTDLIDLRIKVRHTPHFAAESATHLARSAWHGLQCNAHEP